MLGSITDFILLKHRIIFIASTGILNYDLDKKLITHAINLKMQLVQYQVLDIDKKECFVGITEFNDLLKLSDFDQEPQLHRFTDPNFLIKQIFFTARGNLLIL